MHWCGAAFAARVALGSLDVVRAVLVGVSAGNDQGESRCGRELGSPALRA